MSSEESPPPSPPSPEVGREETLGEVIAQEENRKAKIIDKLNSFGNSAITYRYSVDVADPHLVIDECQDNFVEDIKKYFDDNGKKYCRIGATLNMVLEKKTLDPENPIQESDFAFHIKSAIINKEKAKKLMKHWRDSIHGKIEKRLSDVTGSGHIVKGIKCFEIHFLKIAANAGFGKSVPYPKNVRGGECIFNPQSDNNDCVLKCLAAFFLKKRKSKQKWCHIQEKLKRNDNLVRKLVKWDGSDTIAYEDFARLEKLNNVNLFVYTLEKTNTKAGYQVSLVRKGKNDGGCVIDLLILENKHMCLIKDIHSYLRNFTRNRSKTKPIFCRTCLSPFHDEEILNQHKENCSIPTKLIFRKKGEKLRFNNFHKTHPLNYVGFMDSEAMIKPVKNAKSVNSNHSMISYGFCIIDRNDNLIDANTGSGMKSADELIRDLNERWEKIRKEKCSYAIDMSDANEEYFKQQKKCELCSGRFKDKSDKHRHHDHSLEKNNFIGAYCARCNLQCSDRYKTLTVFAHNMSYDLGLVLKEMEQRQNITIHPKGVSKYMSVKIGNIKFIDSLHFLNGSLERLSRDFLESGKYPKFTNLMLSEYDADVREKIIRGKGHFPYEYLDDVNKLQDDRLPPKDAFYSSLKGTNISEEDYNHCKLTWELSNCASLEDYMLLYLKLDIGFLADVFCEWRKILQRGYGLDCAQYLSLPGYAYDAMLKKSGVSLDYPYSRELYELIQKNIRGGFTTVVRQLTSVKNKDLDEKCPDNCSEYILYQDFNSLYATEMLYCMPSGDIRELEEEEKEIFWREKFKTARPDDSKGYWLLIDTKPVSGEVAEKTDELPLCLVNANIREEWLSPYCQNALNKENGKMPKNNIKLVATHHAKKDYLISLPLLQLYMSLGLEVERVKKIYEFSQSPYMREFIEYNIDSRKKAKSKVEQMAYKGMSNCVFGRCCMNCLKYNTKSKVITKESTFLAAIRNPRFKNYIPLREDRVICICDKAEVNIDMPNYIGFQILEMSKYRLYHYWYKVIKAHYGDRARLSYGDTDSLIFSLKTTDLNMEYQQYPFKDYIDFSNFAPSHPLYDNSRKGELGLLKSETGEMLISELIALKPKLYSLLVSNNSTIHRSKGIQKCFHDQLTHDEYKKTLEKGNSLKFKIKNIRNKNGQICTVQYEKKALSCFDDKRYHTSPSHSVAYGRYLEEEGEMDNGKNEISDHGRPILLECESDVEISSDDDDDDDDNDDDELQVETRKCPSLNWEIRKPSENIEKTTYPLSDDTRDESLWKRRLEKVKDVFPNKKSEKKSTAVETSFASNTVIIDDDDDDDFQVETRKFRNVNRKRRGENKQISKSREKKTQRSSDNKRCDVANIQEEEEEEEEESLRKKRKRKLTEEAFFRKYSMDDDDDDDFQTETKKFRSLKW